MVWDIFVERVRVPARGGQPDEAKIATAIPAARQVLAALADIKAGQPWLAGADLSLADIHAFPMLVLFQLAPEGRSMLQDASEMLQWYERLAGHPAAVATRFPIEQG